MANRSYLCGTDLKTTYPSFVDPDYDSDRQTIASDVWCVPLLWTALFRKDDIVRQTFKVSGRKIKVEAPLARRKKAIRQLEEALPYFNRLFVKEGHLDEYVSYLLEAVKAAKYRYVTVELQEIACLTDPEQAYYDEFRKALAGLGKDFSPKAKRRLVCIAQFRKLRRFPPARLLLDDLDGFSKKDYWNHCRVCGAGKTESGIGRRVPWERR